MILAGYNILTKKSTLNWIDYLGTRATVPYCAHGYGAYYTMSIFDRYHHDNINYEEGIDIMRKCIFELEKRLPVASGGYLYRLFIPSLIIELKLWIPMELERLMILTSKRAQSLCTNSQFDNVSFSRPMICPSPGQSDKFIALNNTFGVLRRA
jgi:Proteasome subunit